jgi:predicted phage terminase large subunit-like protein
MFAQPYSFACGPPDARPARGNLAPALEVNGFIEECFTDARGAPVKQAQVHTELQAFLGTHARALVELPRDHGKSFQVCARVLWELTRDPGLRVKIVCATDAVAAERARFLRDAVVMNARLRESFPNLRAARPWAVRAFAVAREAHTIGPSVSAFGAGAGTTGARADLLVCDDIVDVRALHSRAARDHTADYFTNNLMNLLEPDGRFWGLCTPWHRDDLNARLKATGSYPLFRRAIGPDFEPVWPEKWPAARLRERLAEIGTASFARGYRLLPAAEEDAAIRPEWVRFWTESGACERCVLSVDPAVSASSRADRSALVVLGKCGTQVRVLSAIARRAPAPELVHLIDALDREWNPETILFETNAAFLGLKDLLARHAAFGGKLKGVTQSADKAARAAAFSVAVENGTFLLAGEAGAPVPAQRELYDEMTSFPFGERDDLLDAAATGCAFLLDRREPRAWVM